MSRFGSAPIQQAYRDLMQAIAEVLDDHFNGDRRGTDRRVGFVLLIFPFGHDPKDGHRTNYISNASRDDVVTMLKEQVSYFDGMPDNAKGHT